MEATKKRGGPRKGSGRKAPPGGARKKLPYGVAPETAGALVTLALRELSKKKSRGDGSGVVAAEILDRWAACDPPVERLVFAGITSEEEGKGWPSAPRKAEGTAWVLPHTAELLLGLYAKGHGDRSISGIVGQILDCFILGGGDKGWGELCHE